MDPSNYYNQILPSDVEYSLHNNLLSEVSKPRQKSVPKLFHKEIKPNVKLTNQKSSGRCWIFAGLNMLRRSIIKEYKLPSNFELSQSYLFFWDKMERMNYYIKKFNQWKNEEKTLQDREVLFMLKSVFEDGGQWSMFVNLVNKYGLVPKTNYPESVHTKKTAGINMVLSKMLRNYIAKLFDNQEVNEIELMNKTYEILVRFFGKPPTKFIFEYSKKKEIKSIEFTPQNFMTEFCKININDYVVLLHDPRHSYQKLYSIQHLNNMEGGDKVKYLNLDMNRCLELTKKSIDNNYPVWFGSDVGQFYHGEDDVLDSNYFDYLRFLKLEDTLTKKDRINTYESVPNHAMVYVGYHLDLYGSIDYWKIENSWGTDGDYDGHIIASNKWFEDYTYNLVLPKKFLNQEEINIWNGEINEEFPLWDPIGVLA